MRRLEIIYLCEFGLKNTFVVPTLEHFLRKPQKNDEFSRLGVDKGERRVECEGRRSSPHPHEYRRFPSL